MTDYSDDPFQMDEEFGMSDFNSTNTSQSLPLPSSSTTTTTTNTVENDIHKTYEEPNSIYGDNKLIRLKLDQFKMDETGGTNTTEDESQQENAYEEDLDDKLDYKLQDKLKLEYEELKKKEKDQPLTPPENFSTVVNQIYRSSFPQPLNFTFLKTLKLKSILCLIPEDYPQLQLEFLHQENIKLFQLGMSGNKEPFVKINHDLITEAIKIVINPDNQPILIHCNRGKHRTGCLVGVLRRLQKWSLTIIFDEYRKFAAPKERPMDQQFIELYDETEIINFAEQNRLLPIKWD
ncbi:tyrosine phosphatase family-domain-containing protein [Scheffersomyces coipomensis]|uniref:tyrosine phosphatase family-domain-containing protein n=1 Tax=Scheffersomyces coipomensis TaxID=1788519 RepID=UPI00315C8B29